MKTSPIIRILTVVIFLAATAAATAATAATAAAAAATAAAAESPGQNQGPQIVEVSTPIWLKFGELSLSAGLLEQLAPALGTTLKIPDPNANLDQNSAEQVDAVTLLINLETNTARLEPAFLFRGSYDSPQIIRQLNQSRQKFRTHRKAIIIETPGSAYLTALIGRNHCFFGHKILLEGILDRIETDQLPEYPENPRLIWLEAEFDFSSKVNNTLSRDYPALVSEFKGLTTIRARLNDQRLTMIFTAEDHGLLNKWQPQISSRLTAAKIPHKIEIRLDRLALMISLNDSSQLLNLIQLIIK